MAKREFAPGLPDPRRFGRVTSLPVGKPLRFVIQKHLARRAGPHYDIRLGPDQGHKPTLLSWAARKLPETPGKKTMAFQQPLHTGAYADFEGEIVSGYGAGTVKTHDKGSVLVTKVTPDKINFVVIHKKHPETFTLVRKSGPKITPKTAREARTQGGSWLMINTTPTDVIKHEKVHYSKVPAKDVAKLFDPEYLHSEKIDGAAALYRVLSDKVEVLSYRPTTKGRPIIHTYRVGGTTGINVPKNLVGSILRGELYGIRRSTGQAIPPQELGGILNASTRRSLTKQQEQGVELRSRIFNVLRHGKKPVSMDVPMEERLGKLDEIMKHLPSPKFTTPDWAGDPESQKALWEKITSGKHPLTSEGTVAWPRAGGKPTKVKVYDESDVFVREIFPGQGKLEGVGAGGFEYSLEPEGPVVGKVGTGFTDATRKQMWETPEEFKGRTARIRSQGQFPGGAHRAPSFISLHEDYPAVKAAALVKAAIDPRTLQLYRERLQEPMTLGQSLKQVGSDVAMLPAASSAWTLGKHMVGKGGGQRLSTALLSKWAPSALGTQAKWIVGKAALPFAAGLEALGALSGASDDPEYQKGKIGYLRSVGREFGRRSDAQQAATQDALKRGFLGGTASSALAGISSPIATTTGLLQSLWRLAKKPFTSKEATVLGPIIKQAVAELGGEGSTMADLIKAADAYQPKAEMSPELAAEMGVKPQVSFGDRLRALITGIKPEELKALREGASAVSGIVGKLKTHGLIG